MPKSTFLKEGRMPSILLKVEVIPTSLSREWVGMSTFTFFKEGRDVLHSLRDGGKDADTHHQALKVVGMLPYESLRFNTLIL